MEKLKFFRFKMQYLVIAVIFFSVSSFCCGDCGNEPDTLEVDLIKLTFSADDNDEKSITVSSNTSWNFSRSESWIEARKSENKLYVKAENYTSTVSSRTGTITITAGDALPMTITVEQAAKEINNLSVSPTLLEFSANETVVKTVSVTTDSKEGWNAVTESSWITLSKKGNTLEVKVGVNTSALERVGRIIVTAGNAPEKTVTVNLKGNPTPDPELPKFAAYKASGKPKMLLPPGASLWTGNFLDEGKQRYSITGWGGKDITVYLIYKNGKFYIDYETPVLIDVTDNLLKGYFVAFTVSGNTVIIIKDYPISYNSRTKTFDFSGKYNGSDVLVGVIGITGSITGIFSFVGAFTECYANVMIVLDDDSDTLQDNSTATRSLKLSGEKINIDIKSIKEIEIKSIND